MDHINVNITVTIDENGQTRFEVSGPTQSVSPDSPDFVPPPVNNHRYIPEIMNLGPNFPAPLVRPLTDEGAYINVPELLARLPEIEEGLMRPDLIEIIAGLEPFRAACVLSAQLLRSLPASHTPETSEHTMLCARNVLEIVLVAIVDCSPDVWTPSQWWPHDKDTMRQNYLDWLPDPNDPGKFPSPCVAYFGSMPVDAPPYVPRWGTPVGEVCSWCREGITFTDSGVFSVSGGIYHPECWQRLIFGGVNHQNRQCHCFGGNQMSDPDELTLREAALAAVVLFYQRNNLGGA